MNYGRVYKTWETLLLFVIGLVFAGIGFWLFYQYQIGSDLVATEGDAKTLLFAIVFAPVGLLVAYAALRGNHLLIYLKEEGLALTLSSRKRPTILIPYDEITDYKTLSHEQAEVMISSLFSNPMEMMGANMEMASWMKGNMQRPGFMRMGHNFYIGGKDFDYFIDVKHPLKFQVLLEEKISQK